MAITSLGYDGTVDEVAWAALSAQLGQQYGVSGANDWAVANVGGQDRTVSIATGAGYGRGVLDTNDAAVNVQLATIASGTRWDTIVARRNWSTNTTTFVGVTGTATQQVTRTNTTPGALDDQPIALVQLTAGNTSPTGLVDLRTWPSKVIGAGSLLAIQQIPTPAFGMEAVAGDTGGRFRRAAAGWVKDRSALGDPVVITPASGASVMVAATGWSIAGDGYINQAYLQGNMLQLDLVLRNVSAGALQIGTSGNFPSTIIGNIAAPYRPSEFKMVACILWGGVTSTTLAGFPGLVRIEPTTGAVRLIGGPPSLYLAQRGSDTGPSFVCTATYVVPGTA